MNDLRVPVHAPEYRYPESSNPYWAKLRTEHEDMVYSDNDTERHRGGWRARFKNPQNPLHVEIGCNGGHVIVEWAAQDPAINYIGLDWKFKQICRAAEKAKKRGLSNIVFFRAYAERLPYMFGPREIDRLCIFFPDPWPRKSQQKNRYITADRLRSIHSLLAPNGLLHIKTDHAEYFEWMKQAINQTADLWSAEELTQDLHAGHPNPESLVIPQVTLFERVFIRAGIKINSVKLRRR